MSLVVYDETDVPAGYISNNNFFFDHFTFLRRCDFLDIILDRVEHVKYASDSSFENADGVLFSKNDLCTEVKTLLNVCYSPDECFFVGECGTEEISYIRYIKDGKVYWPSWLLGRVLDDTDCDIIYRGDHFSDFSDFLMRKSGAAMTNTDVVGTYGRFYVELHFIDRLCILPLGTSSRKTSIFSILDFVYAESKIVHISYNSCYALNIIVNSDAYFDILILDHADLYLTSELLSALLDKCNVLLISLKRLEIVSGHSYGVYDVSCDGNNIKTKRVCGSK